MRIKMDLRNCDCMDLMKEFPDKYFELAIVDPPYGIGEDGGDKKRNRGYNKIVNHEKKSWDNKKPESPYFQELFRVSKNQAIFGANYFVDNLKPSMGWIFWDKRLGGDFSDGEIIYTSFNRALRMFSLSNFHDLKGGHMRIHPTQKPVALYKWLLQNYAKQGDKILDTHLGSMSSVIACYDEKFDITGAELDPDYFKAGMERVNKHTSQVRLDDLI
jgi:site-specific DNA-methyltransferase (adenine-specific)